MARGTNRNRGSLPRGAGWTLLVVLGGGLMYLVWALWRHMSFLNHTGGIAGSRAYLSEMLIGAVLLIALCLAALVVLTVLGIKQRRELLEKLEAMANDGGEMSPAEILELAAAGLADFTGIYLLHNLSNDKYYVGQSKRVLARVRQHFSGNGGNGDVYADYQRGDTFSVRTISLASSGYDSLNALEADAIDSYEAFTRGYNRRRGNRA